MAIFYTETGSFGQIIVSGSEFNLFSISGSAGSIFEVNNSPGSSEVLLISSASAEFLKINNDYTTIISGTLKVTNNVFSRGGTIADITNGVSNSGSYMVWRAPFSCAVTALYGYRENGGIAQVNAFKTGSGGRSFHTGSNLILTTADTWQSATTVQNTNYSSGDSLFIVVSGSAGNTQVAVQVDFVKI